MNKKIIHAHYFKAIVSISLILFGHFPAQSQKNLTIEDLGKTYNPPKDKMLKGLYFSIPKDKVNHGNTSIRNTGRDNLVWKGSPTAMALAIFKETGTWARYSTYPKA